MRDFIKILVLAAFCFAPVLTGCSSVTFLPMAPDESFPPKPEDFEVRILTSAEATDYRIIGQVSYQDSATSSIWNGWTDQHALIMELQDENIEELKEKVREIGGDVLIDVKHELGYGGSSGGVGLGVGMGTGNVGFGVGTSLSSGNPRIIVVTYGHVGVLKTPSSE